MPVACNICKTPSTAAFTAEILGKYQVQYYRCSNCGYLHTEEPYWLNEAYTDAIADMDTGIIVRNQKFAKVVPLVIDYYFDKRGKFIDFGAGYGIFVRMMRDRGYNFYWYDEYSTNIFAKKFFAQREKYELLTSFEVFEHLVDPKNVVGKMSAYSDSILFSTTLIPSGYNLEDLRKWWYLSPETGQHVSLYTEKSLRILASHFGMNFYTNGYNFHLFTKKKINPFLFSILKAFKFIIELLKGRKDDDNTFKDRELYKKQ